MSQLFSVQDIREFRENALQIIVGSALTKLTKLLKLLKFSISAPSTISPIKHSVTHYSHQAERSLPISRGFVPQKKLRVSRSLLGA